MKEQIVMIVTTRPGPKATWRLHKDGTIDRNLPGRNGFRPLRQFDKPPKQIRDAAEALRTGEQP